MREMIDLQRSEIRNIADVLEPLVLEKGSRGAAAEAIGISGSMVGEILQRKGAMRLNAEVLAALARYFKTTPAALLAGKALVVGSTSCGRNPHAAPEEQLALPFTRRSR